MNVWRLILCVVAIVALLGSIAHAYTLTFDDIPVGGNLSYYADQFGTKFRFGFEVSNLSDMSWGAPHSSTNVLIWKGSAQDPATIDFREGQYHSVRSLGAYFSTDREVVIRMTGYHTSTDNPVASVLIGAADEQWTNRYAEITSEAGDIDFVRFEGVYTTGALRGFCADDISIVPNQ